MKESIFDKATRKMDIPMNLVTDQPKITLNGFRDLYIDNHQGLLEYGEREVQVNCGDAVLTVTGEGFVIRTMNARELRIEGLIFGIEFHY